MNATAAPLQEASGGELPPAGFAAALAAFPLMTLSRLAALLRSGGPQHAYAVATGVLPAHGMIARVLADTDVAARWRRHACRHSVGEVWERCVAIGAEVSYTGDPGYPDILLHDRAAPPVLFTLGDRSLLGSGRRIGVVGTRNATAAGREAAFQIANGVAGRGVHVVSGLARGIDGEAHRGTIAAAGSGRPIAVVASGLDVIYPREHRDLWQQVADTGLLITEAPPGTPPEAYRFPLRNRIIAALSEIVVVVESRERGGSLITVTEAGERGIPIMAVPGGLHSRASFGTNNLLREGAGAVVDASDVLVALALESRRRVPLVADQRPRPRSADIAVYEACAAEPRTIDAITLVLGAGFVEVAMSLARLEQAGWVSSIDGWFETVGAVLR